MTTKQIPFSRNRLFAAQLLVYGGLILWLGGVVFFAVGVASIIFKTLPSKDLAGALNGVILHRLNILEHVAAALLLAGLAMTNLQNGFVQYRWQAILPLAAAVLMACLLVFYAHYIAPAMDALKLNINSFDAPNPTSMPFVAEFRAWHVVYSRCVSANALLGVFVLVWQTWLYSSLYTSLQTPLYTSLYEPSASKSSFPHSS
jgi:hypothetical protein